jgi:hypothetical protein
MSLEPLKFHSHIFYLLHQQSPCSNLLPSLFMTRTVFAKEADALLAIRPILIEPPPELRCPLCKNIFKDAVMIPCCQYSFCDKCIREELIAKGKCPQCGSTKFKNDDLLPNINLRQAIDRFLEAQVTTSGASDSFLRQQQAPGRPCSKEFSLFMWLSLLQAFNSAVLM